MCRTSSTGVQQLQDSRNYKKESIPTQLHVPNPSARQCASQAEREAQWQIRLCRTVSAGMKEF
jgi:hypothetical protein